MSNKNNYRSSLSGINEWHYLDTHKNDKYLSMKYLPDYALNVFVEPNVLKYLPNCQIADNPWKLYTT